ncbi:MAG: TonB-dependent receptor [Parasphingopyxis sp.]|uniref:TonB-dependent receptor n=1 Tax=Parasphingopyxis sp. TaxID=1920299 RepID=UPI003FA06560
MIKIKARGAALMASASMIPTAISAQTPEPAAGESETTVQEIVVTAQRRAQNLQDVPAAVSAITGDDLQQRGITETSDLMGALPNLQVTSAFGTTQPNFSLRGISVANEFSAATASPVGVYVDEVYQSFRASHGQQLFDLERVEVLRGPQGTLYGRNTTGGAINFITRRPDLGAPNGYVTLGYANYDTLTAQGAAEVTLVEDQFGVRVAGTYANGDGYTFNPTQNRDFGTTNSIAGRFAARMRSGIADINLRIYGARNDPWQDLAYGIGYLEGRTDAVGYSRFAPRPELGGRILERDEIQSDTGGKYFTSSWGGSLNIELDIADALTLISVTGYGEGRYRVAPFDCDGSPNNICAIRYRANSTNFNQDLRLNYDGDRTRAIVGAYFGIDRIDTVNEPDLFGFLRPVLLGAGLPGEYDNIPIAVGNSLRTIPAFLADPTLTPGTPGFCAPVVVNPSGFFDARTLIAFNADVAATNSAAGNTFQAACLAEGAPPFGPILARQAFTIERPSTAIYGEVNHEIADGFSVTLGMRYTWDTVRYENASSILFDLSGTQPVANLVPYSFPFDPNLAPLDQSRSTGRFSGRVVLDYEVAPDVLLYGSYSRGFRAGTFNALAYQDVSQVYFLEPEKIDAFEVGVRSRFLDRRVQLNLSGFYYDYSNQQIAQIVGATSFLRSADGRVYGLEGELAARVAPGFRIDAALGLLDTRYVGNEIDATDPASLTRDINGNPFPNAPDITFSAGFDWDIIDTARSRLTLRGDAQYMGRYYFDPFKDYGQDPCDQPAAESLVLLATPELACGNPPYWLFNARLTYTYDERFSVALWGRNLTNKFYYTYGINLNPFYQDYLTRGAPRTYGIEATVRF